MPKVNVGVFQCHAILWQFLQAKNHRVSGCVRPRVRFSQLTASTAIAAIGAQLWR
jgi:hypothetical protein